MSQSSEVGRPELRGRRVIVLRPPAPARSPRAPHRPDAARAPRGSPAGADAAVSVAAGKRRASSSSTSVARRLGAAERQRPAGALEREVVAAQCQPRGHFVAAPSSHCSATACASASSVVHCAANSREVHERRLERSVRSARGRGGNDRRTARRAPSSSCSRHARAWPRRAFSSRAIAVASFLQETEHDTPGAAG